MPLSTRPTRSSSRCTIRSDLFSLKKKSAGPQGPAFFFKGTSFKTHPFGKASGGLSQVAVEGIKKRMRGRLWL